MSWRGSVTVVELLILNIRKSVMSYLIAVSGKGGVGKTTVAGLLISQLIKRQCSPVLAVDADPNTCLDDVLGVKVEKSIGAVREDAKKIAGKGLGAGISKQELLEIKIAESLVEASDFDLIAMGRSEGSVKALLRFQCRYIRLPIPQLCELQQLLHY